MRRRKFLKAASVALLLGGMAAASMIGRADEPRQTITAGGPSTSAVPVFDVERPTTTMVEPPPETTAPPSSTTTAARSAVRRARSSPPTSAASPMTTATSFAEVTTTTSTTSTMQPRSHFYDPTNRASSPPAPSALCDRARAFREVSSRIAASGIYTASQGVVRQVVTGTNGGTWSADRRRVAFQSPDDAHLSADLCVLDVASRSAQRITAVMYADGGSYAPGGSELWAGQAVVVNDDATADQLVAVALDTGRKTGITRPAAFDVSPDGTRVAVLEPMDSADRHLHVHDLLHGTARDLPIVRRTLTPYGIRWLDDRTVGFGNSDIITKDVETGAETEVVAKVQTPLASWAYSAKEQRFAFAMGGVQPSEDDGLYTVRRDGSDRRFVSDARAVAPFVWSPDGRALLAVSGDVRDGQSLRVQPLDGTEPTTIATSEPGYAFTLRDGWSPDGSTIEFSVVHIRFG